MPYLTQIYFSKLSYLVTLTASCSTVFSIFCSSEPALVVLSPPCVFVCILRKPKTKRSKRFLEGRAPKLIENVKSAMIMKGGNASQLVTQALKDIVSNLMMHSSSRP